MGWLSEIFGEIRARIRELRPRNTIAIPIVLLLLFIGAGILTAGYYINKSVFHAVFEERESNKARNIHLTIESIVSTEVNRISSLAKILKNDTDIVYGLFHYSETQGGTRPLKSAMSQIYPKMNLRVFVMSDTNGNVLYRAGKEKVPGEGNLERMPAFKKALKGEQVYTVLDAPNGAAALTVCDRHEGRIDLLVTDMVMPGMDGIELARRVCDSRPGIPVLFMSGYVEDAKERLGDLNEGQAFLQKPITPTNLSRKVRELFSGRETGIPV